VNVSTKVQCIWWATARCGSRAVSEVLKHYDFFNYKLSPVYTPESDIRNVSHTHEYGVPKEYADYKIIVQTRNPYSREVSNWHLACFKEQKNELIIEHDFEHWVMSNQNTVKEETVRIYKPSYYIRYEHLDQDIKNIPFVDINDPIVNRDYTSNILANQYKYEGVDDPRGDIRRDNKDSRYADWRSYYKYNNRLADLVYEKYKDQFDLFNYEKDSWKR